MTQQEQDMFNEARMNRFHAGLSNLASWCEKRCDPKHNTETTLTMLERKVAKLREQGITDPWPTDNRTCRHAMNPGFPDTNEPAPLSPRCPLCEGIAGEGAETCPICKSS